jgi:hypothetical protein
MLDKHSTYQAMPHTHLVFVLFYLFIYLFIVVLGFELRAYIHLETLHQSFFVTGFFKTGS